MGTLARSGFSESRLKAFANSKEAQRAALLRIMIEEQSEPFIFTEHLREGTLLAPLNPLSFTLNEWDRYVRERSQKDGANPWYIDDTLKVSDVEAEMKVQINIPNPVILLIEVDQKKFSKTEDVDDCAENLMRGAYASTKSNLLLQTAPILLGSKKTFDPKFIFVGGRPMTSTQERKTPTFISAKNGQGFFTLTGGFNKNTLSGGYFVYCGQDPSIR